MFKKPRAIIDEDWEKLFSSYKNQLDDKHINATELANGIGVTLKTVNKWSQGGRPSKRKDEIFPIKNLLIYLWAHQCFEKEQPEKQARELWETAFRPKAEYEDDPLFGWKNNEFPHQLKKLKDGTRWQDLIEKKPKSKTSSRHKPGAKKLVTDSKRETVTTQANSVESSGYELDGQFTPVQLVDIALAEVPQSDVARQQLSDWPDLTPIKGETITLEQPSNSFGEMNIGESSSTDNVLASKFEAVQPPKSSFSTDTIASPKTTDEAKKIKLTGQTMWVVLAASFAVAVAIIIVFTATNPTSKPIAPTASPEAKRLLPTNTITPTQLPPKEPPKQLFLTRSLALHTRAVNSVAYGSGPNAATFVSASGDGTVRLWPVQAGLPDPNSNIIITSAEPIRAVIFHPFESLIAAGGDDGVVRLSKLSSDHTIGETKIYTNTTELQAQVWGLAFSPVENVLAIPGIGGKVLLWNYKTDSTMSLQACKTSIYELRYNFNGEILAVACEDGQVIVFNTRTRVPRSLVGHKGAVMSLNISPDGKLLASGDNKGVIKVWQLTSFQEVWNVSATSKIVSGLLFSPDNKILVNSSTDSMVKLWDAATGIELGEIVAYPKDAQALGLSFSTDGEFLATSSDPNTEIRVWRVVDKT